MKGICLTIAALFMMSATVSAKGEATKQRGAPTLYENMKRPTPIKVMYDDIDAQNKSEEEPLYIRMTSEDTMHLVDVNERKIYVNYYMAMGDDGNARNLNYGNNATLAPIQGSIR